MLLALLVSAGCALAQSEDPSSQAAPTALSSEERAALEQRVADLETELAELKDLLLAIGSTPPQAATQAVTVVEEEEEDYPTSDFSGSGMLEYRHLFNEPGVNTGRIRRARITVRGDLSDDTSYKMDVDGTGGARDLVRDLYISYDASDSSTWKIGQFKMPQSYAQNLSRMSQPLPERPLVSEQSTWNGAQFYGLAANRHLGLQYQYQDDDGRNTVQAAIFGGAGRNTRDENSSKDFAIRYQYADEDDRHQAAISYRTGQQYDPTVAGNYLQTWGLEYRYHGQKHWVETEWMTGQARGNGALVGECGGYIQWIYWPDGTKRYAYWPSKGSGDEFWSLRLERIARTANPGNRASVAWLGYTRFLEDDWKAQLAFGYQRGEQRLYLTNYWKF